MVAHKAKAQDYHIKSQQGDRDIVHSGDKVLPALEDVIPLQSMTAYMIIAFHFFDQVKEYDGMYRQIVKKILQIFLFFTIIKFLNR